MVGVPINFAIPGEGAVISYDWSDFSEGTGRVTFDGFAAQVGAATTYHITKDVIGTASTKRFSQTTSETLAFNLPAFETPRIVRGTFTSTFTYGARTGAGSTATLTVTIKVYHVRGAVATEIGSAASPTLSLGADSTDVDTACVYGTLTETNFAIGDILRVSAVIAPAGTNSYATYFGFDPLERDAVVSSGATAFTVVAADNPTSFKTNIPFKIDQ